MSRLTMGFVAGGFFAFLSLLSVVSLSPEVYASHADDLSNVAPTPANSDPEGGHDFYIRKSDSEGIQSDIRLSVYYKTQPDGSSINLSPRMYNFGFTACSTSNQVTPGTDAFREYLTVRIKNPINNGNERVYYINKNQACQEGNGDNNTGSDAGNAFFANYPVPVVGANDIDTQTNMYKLNVTISLHGGVPRPPDGEGFGQRISVRSSRNEALISQLGGNGNHFPILGDFRPEVQDRYTTQMFVPFGLPCNYPDSSAIRRVGVYDSDNGQGFGERRVRLQVYKYNKDTTQWERVNLSDPQAGGGRGNGTIASEGGVHGIGSMDTYIPPDGRVDELNFTSVQITMQKDTKYMLRVMDLAPRNTVDIQIPEASIFGTINCGWEMKPRSTVDKPFSQRGETVTFTHIAKNIGNFTSDEVTAAAKWGKRGKKTTNANVTVDGGLVTSIAPADPGNPISLRRYSGDETEASNKREMYISIKIPADAADGDEYCQYLRISKKSGAITEPVDSDPYACTKVSFQPPPCTPPAEGCPVTPNRIPVELIPRAVNGADIEPTETTTISGSVEVKNFPGFSNWGYDEESIRGDARQVPITSSGGYPEPRGPIYGTTRSSTTTRSVPYCPDPVDDQLASECRHNMNAYDGMPNACANNGGLYNNSTGQCRRFHPFSYRTESTTRYYCDSGYTPMGDTASPSLQCVKYQWRCYGSTGAWSDTMPTSCPVTYNCGNDPSLVNTSTNPPSCRAWMCPYTPASTPIRSDTKPVCQSRCNAGFGLPALINETQRSDGNTDKLPCRQPPSFSMVCRWDSGEMAVVNVNRSGIYCNNSVQRFGQTIGVKVCAVKSVDRPIGWSPSRPSPGYRYEETYGVYSQYDEWYWDVKAPAEGCSRVVGKPTVKVFGGDVAAGGGFALNNSCTSNTSSIIGWPHAPAYDASYTQFGGFASGNITGFATAKVNSGASMQPKGLAFANTTAAGEKFGGNFGPMPCITDHYGNPSSLPSQAINTFSGSEDGAYQASGGTMNNLTIQKGRQLVVNTTQNVYISGNIKYVRGGWAGKEDIPAFKLVVSGANIYIDKSVTDLDGVFVAQPSGGVGGNIYTCSSGTSAVADSSLYTECQKLLNVNGVFVAKKINFGRTFGTAIRGQTAERFNYLPEVWLADWPSVNSNASNIKYDSIINLPPIL